MPFDGFTANGFIRRFPNISQLSDIFMISKMHKTLIASAIAALAAFYGQTASAADAGDFSFTTGLDYSSGKYGGTESTDILYIPFIGKYAE